jgi:hypothetical protein
MSKPYRLIDFRPGDLVLAFFDFLSEDYARYKEGIIAESA